jgi:hypothetical protein
MLKEGVNGIFYIEYTHLHRYAMSGLGDRIHYALVDKTGPVSKIDPLRATNSAVWLEFGPIKYLNEDIKELELQDFIKPDYYINLEHTHDYELDSTAPTFDEALVKLSNKVLKKYGDYEDDNDELATCGGLLHNCPECVFRATHYESLVNK